MAEIQGLYGTFSFPEKLLQKIWLQGDFDRSNAFTTGGERLHVVQVGKWNLLGGPDFTGARLRLGGPNGREFHGDVEVHLKAQDWETHGHARDPAYDRVMLHVVLFPPPPSFVTRGAGGREIPIVALLPLLHRGLEEFAADEAVETLANRPLARLPEELGRLPAVEVAALLRRHATERWRQKVGYARLRLQKLGWEAACHHAALEIMGFRFNRAPMLNIAGRLSLREWTERNVDADQVFSEEKAWSLQGVRPANHPRVRLRQYALWCCECPDWPARLRAWAGGWSAIECAKSTRDVRREAHFTSLRARVANEFCGDALGGSRLDTWVCDGMLPLLAAQYECPAEGVWFHWFPGDLPAWLISGLRQLGYFDGRVMPASHGVAQGLLGWLLSREPRA